MNRLEFEERFWSKADWDIRSPDRCWNWLAAKSTNGYGRFQIARHVIGAAHRVAYELEVGPIPPGKYLDHLCRNRSCVNPEHLEPVTSRENTLRGESHVADRARQTHCLRGHNLSGTNLVPHPHSRVCRECKNLRARKEKA